MQTMICWCNVSVHIDGVSETYCCQDALLFSYLLYSFSLWLLLDSFSENVFFIKIPGDWHHVATEKKHVHKHTSSFLFYTHEHRSKRNGTQATVHLCMCVFTFTRVACQQVCRPNTQWHNYYKKRNRVNRTVCVSVCLGERGGSCLLINLDGRH